MAITSGDIHNQSFSIDRKGYNVDEVDVFLERVANEIDVLNSQVEQMSRQIDELNFELSQREAAPAPAEVSDHVPMVDATPDEKDERIAELERKLEERKLEDNAIAKALITAQRSGDEVIAKAKADAEGMRQDAEDEARRILDKANAEKQRIIESIETLQANRESVRAEYQDLLKSFINSATKTLSEVGGDLSSVSYQQYDANEAETTGRVMPRAQAPVRREVSSAVATYTTPQVSNVVVTPATPKPSKIEKDLSGYGDADDAFEFEDVE